MRVNVYDKVSWPGFMQWCLKTSWLLGCVFQKLIGVIDDYYGAESWDDALAWLKKQNQPITSLQYWGHGSPGTIWLAQKPLYAQSWLAIKPLLAPDALVWFRVCSSFQGSIGQVFAKQLADGLNCTVAGHTHIIGLFQPGLYTMKPKTMPSWPIDEGVVPPKWRTDFSPWLKHTILCLQWWIPKGW